MGGCHRLAVVVICNCKASRFNPRPERVPGVAQISVVKLVTAKQISKAQFDSAEQTVQHETPRRNPLRYFCLDRSDGLTY